MSAARRASIPLATIRHWGYRNYIPNNGLKRFLLAGADKKEIDLLLKNVREVPPMVDMAIKLRDEGKDWEVFLE